MGHILDELTQYRTPRVQSGSQPQGSQPLGPPQAPPHDHPFKQPEGSELASLLQKLQTRPGWVQNSMLVVGQYEANLGTTPLHSGKFTIAGLAGLTLGKPVLVSKAAGPYTGKGLLADEAEMDHIVAQGTVVGTDSIDVFWNCPTFVQAKIKFNYQVGG